MTALEHEQYRTVPPEMQLTSPVRKVKASSKEMEEEEAEMTRVHFGGFSPPFPSTPQASSPEFWKGRLESSPKRLALSQSSPERNRGYKSAFGRVSISLKRKLLYSFMYYGCLACIVFLDEKFDVDCPLLEMCHFTRLGEYRLGAQWPIFILSKA